METADKVLHRLAHVVGKVNKKPRFVFSVFGNGPNFGGTSWRWRISCTRAFITFAGHLPTLTKDDNTNHLKAKISSLHGDKLHRVMLDNDEPNRLAGERPALFRIIQIRKRQETRIIRSVQDKCGNTQQTMKGNIRAFTTFLRSKYESIAVDEACVAYMAETGQHALPTAREICCNNPSHWRKYTTPWRKEGRIKCQEVTVLG